MAGTSAVAPTGDGEAPKVKNGVKVRFYEASYQIGAGDVVEVTEDQADQLVRDNHAERVTDK